MTFSDSESTTDRPTRDRKWSQASRYAYAYGMLDYAVQSFLNGHEDPTFLANIFAEASAIANGTATPVAD